MRLCGVSSGRSRRHVSRNAGRPQLGSVQFRSTEKSLLRSGIPRQLETGSWLRQTGRPNACRDAFRNGSYNQQDCLAGTNKVSPGYWQRSSKYSFWTPHQWRIRWKPRYLRRERRIRALEIPDRRRSRRSRIYLRGEWRAVCGNLVHGKQLSTVRERRLSLGFQARWQGVAS